VGAQACRLPLPFGYENLSGVSSSYAILQRTQI